MMEWELAMRCDADGTGDRARRRHEGQFGDVIGRGSRGGTWCNLRDGRVGRDDFVSSARWGWAGSQSGAVALRAKKLVCVG